MQIVAEHEVEFEQAAVVVYSVLGFLILTISIMLYRIDGDLLHCEPYYLRDEIDK